MVSSAKLASSIHTIPSKNIAFIQVFFFESTNSMQYRSQTRQGLLSFDWTRVIASLSLVWSPKYAINLCGLTHCQLIYDTAMLFNCIHVYFCEATDSKQCVEPQNVTFPKT